VSVIAAMAILRDVLRIFVFEPFARWKLTRDLMAEKEKTRRLIDQANGGPVKNGHAVNGNGIVSKSPAQPSKKDRRRVTRSVLRFAEQGWQFVYYTPCWAYGLWVHHHLPTQVLNPEAIWINYPHLPLAAPIKLYYLIQFAFYLHQILLLHAEERRKDHYQMLLHHVVTIGLLLMSYFYGYTRIGCIVLVLMDTVDVFLPFAKMLRYLNFTNACDYAFAAFLISWVVTRHMLFPLIIWSTYKDMLRYMPYAWEPSRGYYVTFEIWAGFLILMSALEITQIVWFKAIFRVAYLVITGQGAADTRSEEGDSDEEAEKES
jgi:acyl-CoA-dependent ceramide synthase